MDRRCAGRDRGKAAAWLIRRSGASFLVFGIVAGVVKKDLCIVNVSASHEEISRPSTGGLKTHWRFEWKHENFAASLCGRLRWPFSVV